MMKRLNKGVRSCFDVAIRCFFPALCSVGVMLMWHPASAAEAPTAQPWTMPRMPDGRPNLQGIWTNKSVTPLERPADLGTQAFFTEEDAKTYMEKARLRGDKDKRTDDVNDVLNAYNDFWWDSGTEILPNMRTSIVTDPPNGRVPPLLAKRRAQLEAEQVAIKERCKTPGCAVNNGGAMSPAYAPEVLDLMTRCISFGTTVPMLATAYNNNYQFVQAEGVLAINTEMVHQVRRIPTDNSPHLPAQVKQWYGDPRGHWEGDTLVVESTNFLGQYNGRLQAADENLRVIERFTLTAPDILLYQFTVEDPTVWEKPWSGEIPLTRSDGLLYEYACHEGNRGIQNILRATRQAMQAKAAQE
jgi:hypothetical protein